MSSRQLIFLFLCFSCFSWPIPCLAQEKVTATALPGTERLTMEGDIAAQMVAGVDKFLLREIELSVGRREKFWKRDFSSPEAYNKSIEPNRQRLAKILGVIDERVPFEAPELIATVTRRASEGQPGLVGKGENYEIFAVRWPAVRNVHGEGLLLVPKGEKLADIIAIPDADQTPEQICGLAEGVAPESQFARRLAENGCRVLVPTLISREMSKRAPPGTPGRANLTNREFVYRPAFELGRHIVGYELQKILAGVDWFAKDVSDQAPKIGIIGYGEGAMLALYAGALDQRISSSFVSGYFDDRQSTWNQPIDRNVFGLLEQFGDTETIHANRDSYIECLTYPRLKLPSEGGAPSQLDWPAGAVRELERFKQTVDQQAAGSDRAKVGRHAKFVGFVPSQDFCTAAHLKEWLQRFGGERGDRLMASAINALQRMDNDGRQQHQIDEIIRDTQQVLAESPYVRQKFMQKLYDCKTVAEYEKTAEEYREYFATQVIGRFDYPLEKANPRSRKSYETPKWTGYEVVLDVFPDVFAYGILCLPKDLKPGEKRPVVVCQHGLEGRPQDVIGEQKQDVYAAFAGQLAERGFITFAPQNLYIGKDNFRTLQRKANPLGKTLFSIMVPQHQQICNWLKTLPNVDGERIAFYGLSYGGKSAMRIPPLVKDYCLSICSADFNDWVDKNASTRAPYSYVWTGEYEIFEWDLGSTFNYAEMAALIAPRPFMVERGHFDGVGVDERVAAEYAKVQRIYNVQLKMPDRCAIEYFVGPHKINGVGTYAFLHKHLKWPEPTAEN